MHGMDIEVQTKVKIPRHICALYQLCTKWRQVFSGREYCHKINLFFQKNFCIKEREIVFIMKYVLIYTSVCGERVEICVLADKKCF
jgi:hypothetical protein